VEVLPPLPPQVLEALSQFISRFSRSHSVFVL
jgi:hypothetical protein